MKIIQITEEKLKKMKDLKDGLVHVQNGIVYKHDSESEELIKRIVQLGNHPYLEQLAKPIDLLEIEKEYYGYTMLYYKNIKLVTEAIKSGIIKNLGDYFDELFMVLTKLNTLKLIYWDFHENNIFADEKGRPFILDLDDISQEDSDENLLEQKEYLTEFLLGTYLERYRGFYSYFITPAFKEILNSEANEYLEAIRESDYSLKDMPYCVLTELEDQDKTNALKLRLK
jgi:hypothetical protein